VIRSIFEYNVFMANNAFIDMYVKCRDVIIAHKLFKIIPKHNFWSWNAIIFGYSQSGHTHEALIQFFNQMKYLGIKPNSMGVVSVFHACVDLLGLEQGKKIHIYAIIIGF
jgi:pentatricopeptide repeat protein